MKKQIFAVCDLEAEYACNFMDYLNTRKSIPFEVQAFTSVESLLAYGKENPIELLLISAEAMCKEVKELNIGKIVKGIIRKNGTPTKECINISHQQMLCGKSWRVMERKSLFLPHRFLY